MSFLKLGRDVQLNIFLRCSCIDLCRLSRCSKALNVLISNTVWGIVNSSCINHLEEITKLSNQAIEQEESKIVYREDGLHSGSRKDIIKLILTEECTPEIVAIFFSSLKTFTTPEKFLLRLVSAFESIPKDGSQDKKKSHLWFVLTHWLTDYFKEDFNNTIMIDTVVSFILSTLRRDSPPFSSMVPMLLNVIKLNLNYIRKQAVMKETIYRIGEKDVLEYPVSDIAKQLTEIDNELYNNVRTRDLIEWESSRRMEGVAESIKNIINRFNLLSKWTAIVVLEEDEIIKRASIVQKFIQIMIQLENMNNYASLLSIYSGLSTSPTARLKQTWEKVPKDLLKKWQGFGEIVDRGYKMYRDRVTQIGSSSFIPYLGLTLTDLTFIEDGNPGVFSTNMLNFGKLKLKYQSTKSFLKFQGNLHDTKNETTHDIDIRSKLDSNYISSFLSSKSYNDEKQYARSIELEPRSQR